MAKIKRKTIKNNFNNDLNNKVTNALNSVNNILRNKSDQFLLVGLDETILNLITNKMMENKNFQHVIVKNKDLDPDNKIFYIYLKNQSSLEYQSLLYYYLELPFKYNCHICLISTSCNCLSFFEKRVRSRFNNRIIFISNDTDSSCTTSKNNKDDFNNTIYDNLMKKNNLLMNSYNLNNYSCNFIFDFLEPIHLVLIYISYTDKINVNDCYYQFLKVTKDIVEIKKADSFIVNNCMQDLTDFGIINYNGKYIWDYNEYRNYLIKKAPRYLKNLLSIKYL